MKGHAAGILLPFDTTCLEGTFVQRRKRFSVEILVNGQSMWVHSNNTGSMLGLLQAGNEVLVSLSSNPKRKMPGTLELIKSQGGWVGVNTSVPLKLLRAAFKKGQLPFAVGYSDFKAEVLVPPELAVCGASEKVRLDALFGGPGKAPLWVECKNVTLVENGVAAFPDAKTERGQKHLRTLINLVKNGQRAVCFYLVQRSDGRFFGPADYIDEIYAEIFWQALEAGVEIYPYRAVISRQGIGLGELLPLAGAGFARPESKTGTKAEEK